MSQHSPRRHLVAARSKLTKSEFDAVVAEAGAHFDNHQAGADALQEAFAAR
jgi:hypothetical protein